jgi:nitrogen fixation NifU-like protein
MKNQDVVDALGGMPPIKVHCSLLAIEALNKALGEYEKGNK